MGFHAAAVSAGSSPLGVGGGAGAGGPGLGWDSRRGGRGGRGAGEPDGPGRSRAGEVPLGDRPGGGGHPTGRGPSRGYGTGGAGGCRWGRRPAWEGCPAGGLGRSRPAGELGRSRCRGAGPVPSDGGWAGPALPGSWAGPALPGSWAGSARTGSRAGRRRARHGVVEGVVGGPGIDGRPPVARPGARVARGWPPARGKRGLSADELPAEQPAATPDQHDDDGRHHRGKEHASDPLGEARGEPRRGRAELGVVDLAGHDGRHEEREGGSGEEQVDLAAPDAKRGRDGAHDDEEPEQATGLLAGHQGDDDAEHGADREQEHGRPRRHPAKPAGRAAGPEAVEAEQVARGPTAVHHPALARRARPTAEIVSARTAPLVAVSFLGGTPRPTALWPRAVRPPVAGRRRAARREARAFLPAAAPGR